jgi:hypothetical protein
VVAQDGLQSADFERKPRRKIRSFKVDRQAGLAVFASEVNLVEDIVGFDRSRREEYDKLGTGDHAPADAFVPIVSRINPFVVPDSISFLVKEFENGVNLGRVRVPISREKIGFVARIGIKRGRSIRVRHGIRRSTFCISEMPFSPNSSSVIDYEVETSCAPARCRQHRNGNKSLPPPERGGKKSSLTG